MPETVDRDGAFVEHLVSALGPMLTPPDIEVLADMARRAGERDALRQALTDLRGYLEIVAAAAATAGDDLCLCTLVSVRQQLLLIDRALKGSTDD